MLESQLAHLSMASIFVRTNLVIGSALVAVTGLYSSCTTFVGGSNQHSKFIIIISCCCWLQLSRRSFNH